MAHPRKPASVGANKPTRTKPTLPGTKRMMANTVTEAERNRATGRKIASLKPRKP